MPVLTLRRKAFGYQLGLLDAFDTQVFENIGGGHFAEVRRLARLSLGSRGIASHSLQVIDERLLLSDDELRHCDAARSFHGPTFPVHHAPIIAGSRNVMDMDRPPCARLPPRFFPSVAWDLPDGRDPAPRNATMWPGGVR
jgi:hypothetical protein